MSKPRLFLVGDFACHTGFARVNEALAQHLREAWQISVLAINYMGDAHPLQSSYALYPAHGGGDLFGIGRIAKMIDYVQPDALLLVHDLWVVSGWLRALQDAAPPCVAYIPIDGTGVAPYHAQPLSGCSTVVAYTRFGAAELVRAGCTAPVMVIPHGIDHDVFYPIEKSEARAILGMDADAYAVLVADQNQPRKRLDIAFEAFARFAMDKPEARLIYHGPPRTENGWDVEAMAVDLGIGDRLLLSSRHITQRRGVKDDHMRVIYSACDAKLSTTSGEGWGLTTMEAMACGLPNIVPDFGALAEWAQGAALCVPSPVAVRHCGQFDGVGINTVGRVPEPRHVADALDLLYRDRNIGDNLAARGLSLVSDPRYAWPNIAAAFHQLLLRAVERQEAIEGRAFVEDLVSA